MCSYFSCFLSKSITRRDGGETARATSTKIELAHQAAPGQKKSSRAAQRSVTRTLEKRCAVDKNAQKRKSTIIVRVALFDQPPRTIINFIEVLDRTTSAPMLFLFPFRSRTYFLAFFVRAREKELWKTRIECVRTDCSNTRGAAH